MKLRRIFDWIMAFYCVVGVEGGYFKNFIRNNVEVYSFLRDFVILLMDLN